MRNEDIKVRLFMVNREKNTNFKGRRHHKESWKTDGRTENLRSVESKIQRVTSAPVSPLRGTPGIPADSFVSVGVYNEEMTLNASDRQPSPLAATCSRSLIFCVHPASGIIVLSLFPTILNCAVSFFLVPSENEDDDDATSSFLRSKSDAIASRREVSSDCLASLYLSRTTTSCSSRYSRPVRTAS